METSHSHRSCRSTVRFASLHSMHAHKSVYSGKAASVCAARKGSSKFFTVRKNNLFLYRNMRVSFADLRRTFSRRTRPLARIQRILPRTPATLQTLRSSARKGSHGEMWLAREPDKRPMAAMGAVSFLRRWTRIRK